MAQEPPRIRILQVLDLSGLPENIVNHVQRERVESLTPASGEPISAEWLTCAILCRDLNELHKRTVFDPHRAAYLLSRTGKVPASLQLPAFVQ